MNLFSNGPERECDFQKQKLNEKCHFENRIIARDRWKKGGDQLRYDFLGGARETPKSFFALGMPMADVEDFELRTSLILSRPVPGGWPDRKRQAA